MADPPPDDPSLQHNNGAGTSNNNQTTASAALDLNLIDYFAVIGFDARKGLQVDVHAESACELSGGSAAKAPMDRSYQASILQVLPQHERRAFPFPVEISSLCMPKGLRFYTEKKVPNQTEFHSFVLVKEDGSRVNGCVFTFYELIADPEVRQQMLDLNHQYIASKVEADSPYRTDNSRPAGNHTLPRNVSSTSRRNFPNRESYYDSASKAIYVAKCLCVVQRIPALFSTQNLLCSVWLSAFRPQKTEIRMENLIYWALNQVPLPIPGTSMQCSYGQCDFAIRRPGLGELPFFDYPMADLFGLIDFEQFVRLYTCFLLEHQILLCSRSMDRLMLVAECLSTLVFPFRWQLTYVPILPYSQLKFIEAPVPYLMGFCYEDRIPEQIFQSNICILDIDSKKLDYPEEVPSFPRHEKLARQLQQLYINFIRNPNGPFGTPKEKVEDPSQNEEENDSTNVKVVMRNSKGNSRRAAHRKGIVDDVPETVNFRQQPPQVQPEQWSMKRMSRSFDNSESMETAFEKPNNFYDEDDAEGKAPEQEITLPVAPTATEKVQKYFQGLNFNNAVRELFLHHFIQLFANYEQFVVIDKLKEESDVRDSVVNFDRASFLSDQPDSYLPFLAAFLETQMFTSFVDSKLLAHWKEADENVVLFDSRIADMKAALGDVQSRISMVAQPVEFNVDCIPQPKILYHYEVPPPKQISHLSSRGESVTFPLLDSDLFDSPTAVSDLSPWKSPNNKVALLAAELDESRRLQNIASPRKKQRKRRDPNQPDTKQQNYTFVKQLLKETKVKTNRLLLMKMGKEAIHLGHHDSAVQGVEENTLVAGFCDLLDRVWANDLKKRPLAERNWPTGDEKKRKSAFWTNVWVYCERNKLDDQRAIHRHHPNMSPGMNEDVQNNNPEDVEDEEDLSSSHDDPGAVIGILNQIKTMAQGVKKEAEAPWSKNLMKVANFISEKVALTPQAMDAYNVRSVESDRSRSRIQEAPFNGPGKLLPWRSNSIAPSEANNNPTLPPQPQRELEFRTLPHKANFYRHREPSLSTNNKADLPRRPDVLGPPRPVHKSVSVTDFTPQLPDSQKPPPPPHSARPEYHGSNPPTPSHGPHRSRRSHSRQPSRERKRSLSRSRDHDADNERDLPPLSTNLINIFRMAEIKTDIGYARAFVRLALERKLLHSHLKTILSDQKLIRDLYKRSAFLRSEDEMEQFLYHILSLNAADFNCFTHTFRSTRMQYEVLFVGTLDRFASSSVWLMCAGTLGSTAPINLPPNSLQFTFDHKNLGVLTTLRIGDREQKSKWLLRYVIVRNNITGQSFRFNCGRWFGRSVEDGALERVLVAEVIQRRPKNDENSPTDPHPPQQYLNSVKNLMSGSMINKFGHNGSLSTLIGTMSRPESPVGSTISEVGPAGRRRSSSRSEVSYNHSQPHQQRNASLSRQPQYNFYSARESSQTPRHKRSPSVGIVEQPSNTWEPQLNELQHKIGESVNALVKYFYSQNQLHSEANLSQLLCGEKGLIVFLEQAFTHGRQTTLSHRIFGKPYPWDYIERVFAWFRVAITNKGFSREQRSIIKSAYHMVLKIASNANVGKEGKFQAFLLLTLKDHQLAALLPLLAWSEVTEQMYDKSSILRQPQQLTALCRLLSSLDEFNMNLETSLTYGIVV